MPKSGQPRKEVTARLLASAKMGITDSMIQIAEIHIENRDYKEAIFWFSEVVRTLGSNHNERWKIAVNKLGSIMHSQKNLTQARQFFEKAAVEGYAPAQFNAGVIAQADGRLEDALHWFEAAARSKHKDALKKVEELRGLVPKSKSTSESTPKQETKPKPPKPRPKERLIRNWQDAEQVAQEWMVYFGFTDAKQTGGSSDEGIDIRSSRAVAQVKFHGSNTPRTVIQLLHSALTKEKKIGICFSLGYRSTAIDFANEQKIALFQFDLQGVPTPINSIARQIMNGA